jgi:hypothetical protein
MRRCEDVKMFDRPPLLEEPFAQTLSGKNVGFQWISMNFSDRPGHGNTVRKQRLCLA